MEPMEGEPGFKGEWLPFTRTDRYGTLGLAPQPLSERVRLLLLALVVVPLKLVGALACLLSFYAVCRLSFLLPSDVRAETVAALGKWHCRACLFCLGFLREEWVKVKREQLLQQGVLNTQAAGSGGDAAGGGDGKPVAIVSNHMGWPDILIHMSRYFPAFAAREQTKRLPFVGIISQLMSCVYVSRSQEASTHGGGVARLIKERMLAMSEGRLPHARPMLLFPEGTTTNGQYLLPFKTGAFLAGVPVQPVVLKYGPDAISPSWETISAPRHIFLIMCNPVHSVTCYELPVYRPNPEEQADPKLYAANVRQLMLSFSGLTDSKATFFDKLAYKKVLLARYGLEKEDGKAVKAT